MPDRTSLNKQVQPDVEWSPPLWSPAWSFLLHECQGTSNHCTVLTAYWLLCPKKIIQSDSWQWARLRRTVCTLAASLACVCVFLTLCPSWHSCSGSGFGSSPDKPSQGVTTACSLWATVGGCWPGQHVDFFLLGCGWKRLDTVAVCLPAIPTLTPSAPHTHSSKCFSASCQVYFPLKVNIASLPRCSLLECQLGTKPSYMWFSIIAKAWSTIRERAAAAVGHRVI